MIAHFQTNLGDFKVRLFADQAPNTVENFTSLAEGTREFEDPSTGTLTTRPFYDGLIFHRIIENFMIQGGCPIGKGFGGPGYKFADEFHPELRHNKAGILSMANSGPNTNGSQFFITLAPTPHLDDAHTVFGEVTEGMDIISKIGSASTGAQDKPTEDILIEKISIEK